MREYVYEPLEADEIRLLELQAGAADSELHGDIHTFRLPEDEEPVSSHEILLTREGGFNIPNAPSYSALSYTWGPDLSLRHTIKVLQNGRLCQLGIKPNLNDALLALLPNQTGTLVVGTLFAIGLRRTSRRITELHAIGAHAEISLALTELAARHHV